MSSLKTRLVLAHHWTTPSAIPSGNLRPWILATTTNRHRSWVWTVERSPSLVHPNTALAGYQQRLGQSSRSQGKCHGGGLLSSPTTFRCLLPRRSKAHANVAASSDLPAEQRYPSDQLHLSVPDSGPSLPAWVQPVLSDNSNALISRSLPIVVV